MWTVKNIFLVSMSTVYLNFDRSKTHLETVLHTLLVCESQWSWLSMVIPKRRCSDTWSIFTLLSSGMGDNWCFCLVVIVIDLVLIRLMTIWLLLHQLDTWSKLSCILLLGDNWCFCLVVIVIDLVLIGLMTIGLLSHQLDTWSKWSCILLLICISFPDVCSVVSSASMSQSTDISFIFHV